MTRRALLAGALLAVARCQREAQPSPTPPVARGVCVGEPEIPPSPLRPGELFPTVGAVVNADPSLRERRVVRVPTRMRVRPVDAGFMVSWDPDSLTPVAIDVGCHMLLGSDSSYGISSPGVDVAQPARSLTGVDFARDGGETLLARPSDGAARVVRARVVIFETDIPAQHEWMPTSGRYRVLHERRFDTPLP